MRQARVSHTVYFQETLNTTTDTANITEQQDIMVTVPVLTVISPSGPVSLTVTTSSTVAVWVSLTQV